MEPFTIGLIIAAIIGAAGAKGVPIILDRLKRAISGKKVCALGPKQIGKSTFLEYLSKGMVIGIDEYRSTVSSVELDGRSFVVNDKNSNQAIKIELKAMVDVGGQKANMSSEWKTRFVESDIVFYIVNAGDLMNERGNAAQELAKGMKLIADWMAELGDKAKKKWVFLIGNYWNTEGDFNKFIEDRQGDYQAKFTECQPIKDAIMTLSAAWAPPTPSDDAQDTKGGKKKLPPAISPQVAAFVGCLLSKTSIEYILLHTFRTMLNAKASGNG